MTDKREKLKKAEKVAGTAIWLETSLTIAKAVAGLLSGSLVLISDAIHSASDIFSIFVSWFGLKIAQKKPDQRFPYGYYKAESLGTLIISFLILYAFGEMFSHGFQRLFSDSSIKLPLLALAISLLDALILFAFGNYEIKIGRQTNSQSLVTMGKENRTHIFSSTAVFIGVLAAYLKVPFIEGAITIAISFLILKIGLSALKDAVFSLMDASPDRQMEEKIAEIIKKTPAVEDFFDLRLRKAGPFVFGEVKVGVRKFVEVKKAYEIADRIEQEVKRKTSQIDSFAVQVIPFKSDFSHLVLPVEDKKGLNSPLSNYFSRSPYFFFINLKKDKIKGYFFLKNPYQNKRTRAGLAAAKMLIEQKSGVLITREIGEIAFYTLRDNLFDIYQTKEKTAKKAIDLFVRGKLKKLEKATKQKD